MIKTAKDISGKEWQFSNNDAIRPAPLKPINRKILGVAVTREEFGSDFFVVRPRADTVPGELIPILNLKSGRSDYERM